MNDAQIKYMVERFLSWKLPENFHPDGGISYSPHMNQITEQPYPCPTGTNLLDAIQATEMVRHLTDGMPS